MLNNIFLSEVDLHCWYRKMSKIQKHDAGAILYTDKIKLEKYLFQSQLDEALLLSNLYWI